MLLEQGLFASAAALLCIPGVGVVAFWYGVAFGQVPALLSPVLLCDAFHPFQLQSALREEAVEEGVAYAPGVKRDVGVVVEPGLVASEEEHHLAELIAARLTGKVLGEDAYAVHAACVVAGACSEECGYLVVDPHGGCSGTIECVELA